jgi:hypothetical protein
MTRTIIFIDSRAVKKVKRREEIKDFLHAAKWVLVMLALFAAAMKGLQYSITGGF